MRILLAVHHFPPDHGGGAEWRAFRTARAFMERGHETRVICIRRLNADMDAALSMEDDEYQGVPVHRLDLNMRLASDSFIWQYDHPAIGEHLTEWIHEIQPDIFHLIGGYLLGAAALAAARQNQVPVVVSLTDFWYFCPRITLLRSDGKLSPTRVDPARCAGCLAGERRRYRWLNRLLPAGMDWFWHRQTARINRLQNRLDTLIEALNRVQVILAPSEFVRSIYIENGINPGILRHSRQGVANPVVEVVKSDPHWNTRLGYMGQMAPHKGVHVLLQALNQIPDAPLELYLYGDTTRFPSYARRLKQLAGNDERINWMGTYPPSQSVEVFNQINGMVMPSLWYENSPNSILESFACKVPVIASNLGGMAELVQDGINGLLFEAGNPTDLSRCIERFIYEPDLPAKLRQNIPAVRSIADEMDELEAIYQEILGRKR